MAVRSFNGAGDDIHCAVGTLGSLNTGARTWAALVQRQRATFESVMSFSAAGPLQQAGLYLGDSGNSLWLAMQRNAGGTFINGLPYAAADGWALVAITKTAGSVAPRGHMIKSSTLVASHVTAPNSIGDDGSLTAVVFGEQTNGGDGYQGLLAVAGCWAGTALTDLQVESLATSLQNWINLNPTALWRFDQASITTPVTDITGHDADQASINGTSVVAGNDPPNFSFTLGGPPANVLPRVYAPFSRWRTRPPISRWRTSAPITRWRSSPPK